MSDDIRLRPCPVCEGLPVVLVRPFYPRPALRVECTKCAYAGPWIYFNGRHPIIRAFEDIFLPGLARAREEAAACWNEGAHEQG